MIKIKSIFAFLIFTLGIYTAGFSQYYNLVDENFENSPTWSFDDGAGNNHFIIGTCAGNSSTSAGSVFSLYVAPNEATDNGCVIGSNTFYGYKPSTGGTDSILAYTDIPSGTCVQGDMILTFDYKLETNDASDTAIVVYRKTSADAWSYLTRISTATNTWLNASYSLPNTLNGQPFQIGFYYYFDGNSTAGIPLAVDNLVVKGLDIVPPVIDSCVATQYLYGDSTCSAVLPKFTNLVVASDNCAPVGNLSFTQSPDMGEVATGTTTITITVYDLASNSTSCQFNVEMIDTIKPWLVCDEDYLVTNNSNSCDYQMPDLAVNVITIHDNCSTSGFTISQSIVENTTVHGVQNVTVFVEDEQGNKGSCMVRVTPKDTIPPTVICPSDTVIDNNTDCRYMVADFTSEVIATDNCTISTIVQVPVAGDSIDVGTHQFSMRATDEIGNYSDCVFEVKVIETQTPIITFCPSNISTCDPHVLFNEVVATDNCLFEVIKTDLSGLHSDDIFPVGTTHLQYTAIDSSGNQAVCNFDITILPSPEDPMLPNDVINICNTSTTTIVANPVTVGDGFWSLPSGSTLVIADVHQATTTVSNLSEGANKIYWNTTSSTCGSNQVMLTVNNFPLPSPAVIAKDTTYKCNDNNLLISANPPLKGTGLWSTPDTVNKIVNANNYNAIASNLNGGWNIFYYTVSSGVCPSSVDSLVVYKRVFPKILSFKDTSVCEKIELQLEGTAAPDAVETLWFFEKGIGKFSDEDSTVTTLLDYQKGENIIIYSINNPHCNWESDTMKVTYGVCGDDEFIIPTLITPNQDGKNDAFVIDNLDITYPNCKVTIVNRWGGLVFKSTGYPVPWDGTFKGKPVPVGTYYYVIELNDGSNKSLNGPISVLR